MKVYTPAMYFIVLVLLFFLSACSGKSVPVSSDWVGRTAPPTYLTKMDGSLDTIALGGRSELVLFWASWCSASKSELEQLAALSLEDDHVFYAISIDEQKDETDTLRLVEKYFHTPIVFGYSGDGVYDQAFRHFRGNELPLVVAINRLRKVVYVGSDVDDALNALQ